MKKHTEAFKQEAVRIALSSGLSRRRVASFRRRFVDVGQVGCAIPAI